MHVDSSADDQVIEMTGAANCISYYGIADLNEILSAIQLNSTCDLAASRSVKVKHYFQVIQLLSIYVFVSDLLLHQPDTEYRDNTTHGSDALQPC